MKLNLLFVLVCLVLTACEQSDSEVSAVIHPVKQDFQHTISAQGQVKPVNVETLTVPRRMWGTLEMLADEGQSVKKGDVVAKINTRQFVERMNRYYERFSIEQANMKEKRARMPLQQMKLQAEIQEKRRQANEQSLDLDAVTAGPRLDERVRVRVQKEVSALKAEAYPLAEKERLHMQGYLSEQEVLSARQEIRELQTTRDTADLTLQQQSRSYRQQDIEQQSLKSRAAELETHIAELNAQAQRSLLKVQNQNQRARVKSFERRSSSVKERLDGATMRAPFDGTVIYPKIWGHQTPYVGMDVWNGLGVIQVAQTDQLHVITRVDEFSIPHVKEGQGVKLSSPGFPNALFQGRVSKIQKLAKYKDESKPVGLKYFEIEVALEPGTEQLKANMRLELEIQVKHLKQVWTVPLEALVQREEQSFLRINQEGQIIEKAVKVLAQNQNRAAIQDELSGQEVLVLAS